MGIINVTPDSFSDGGVTDTLDAAVAAGLRLAADGADILDIGGESTRPGAVPVPPKDEADRVLPVIKALRASTSLAISVDTRRPQVAAAALEAGAPRIAARSGCRVILVHMQGDPATMQRDPRYGDVEREVREALLRRAEVARRAGVLEERIMLDPGIGFGKTLEHNLRLLASLPALVAEGYPIVLGASRKGFIRALDALASDPLERLGGSIAAALIGARAGCAVVRAHDVRPTVQALVVDAAVRGARTPIRASF
jgi:dihydropteroate synthase